MHPSMAHRQGRRNQKSVRNGDHGVQDTDTTGRHSASWPSDKFPTSAVHCCAKWGEICNERRLLGHIKQLLTITVVASNQVVGSSTKRQDCRFGPRSDPQGEAHGCAESISPGAPLNQQVIGPYWIANFSCRHYVGGKYPKLLPLFVRILHVAYMHRLTCFAQ